jgi:hypothetical protein
MSPTTLSVRLCPACSHPLSFLTSDWWCSHCKRVALNNLRLVAWCNAWNRSAALHGDYGSMNHLTESTGLSGVTLCGRTFPMDKGYPGNLGRTCKRCLNKAYKAGQPKGFTKSLAFVPSTES